jgi:hypothetical protein
MEDCETSTKNAVFAVFSAVFLAGTSIAWRKSAQGKRVEWTLRHIMARTQLVLRSSVGGSNLMVAPF